MSNHGADGRLLPWYSYYLTTSSSCDSLLESTVDHDHGTILCPLCLQHFKNLQFIDHITFHFKVDVLRSGASVSYGFCMDCHLTLEKLKDLPLHRSVHAEVCRQTNRKSADQFLICPVCELSFASEYAFAFHINRNHREAESPYVCKICYMFKTSRYHDFLIHFKNYHIGSNFVFCPYCLMTFSLPLSSFSSSSNFPTFEAAAFVFHIGQHWSNTPVRCNSCRLAFVDTSQECLHQNFSHVKSPITGLVNGDDHTSKPDPDSKIERRLSILYTNELRTRQPRMRLKCAECGALIRQALIDHFSLSVTCALCPYASSCYYSASHHWSVLHSCPPIPGEVFDFHPNLISWETAIGLDWSDENREPTIRNGTAIPVHCDVAWPHQCHIKQTSYALEPPCLLSCECGYITILGDQMAEHLTTQHNDDSDVRAELFTKYRLDLFQILRPNLHLRSLDRWYSEQSHTPVELSSVGIVARSRN